MGELPGSLAELLTWVGLVVCLGLLAYVKGKIA